LTLHVFGVILWIGSVLTISTQMRLASDEVGAARDALIASAHRLLRLSANPSALIAILFGVVAMLLEPYVLTRGWLHVKLACVIALLVCHFQLYRRVTAVERDPGSLTRRAFVMIHSLVSVFLLIALVMVLVKPF
jgi:putative membrane protein